MRKLVFAPESYIEKDEIIKGEKSGRKFLKVEDGEIGVFELLQSGIENSPLQGLTKKDHKVIKRLKESMTTIARFRDQDEDAMCLKEGGPHELVIEEDEYDVMVRLFTSMTDKLPSKFSDQVTSVFDILDKAETFTQPKLVTDGPQTENKG